MNLVAAGVACIAVQGIGLVSWQSHAHVLPVSHPIPAYVLSSASAAMTVASGYYALPPSAPIDPRLPVAAIYGTKI